MLVAMFLLALAAVVCFLLAAFNVPRMNWFALGFACAAGILAVQYGAALG